MAIPEEDPPAGVPEWIVTYGDMMSLLLCFFILLASLSEMRSDDKSKMVIASVLEQFGDAQQISNFYESIALNRHNMKVGSTVTPIKQANPTVKQWAASGSEGAPGKRRRVQTIRDGQRVTVGGPVLFQPGSSELSKKAKEALLYIASDLRGKRHMIEVRGYESLVASPINSRHVDPVDLAYERARKVVDFLVQEGKLRREIMRMTIAAPVESAPLPALDDGEPVTELVAVLAAESMSSDYQDPRSTSR